MYQKNELFKADVNRWGRERKIKEAFAMIKAIFDIASTLPSVIALGPEVAIAPMISLAGQMVQLGQAALESVVDAVNTTPAVNKPVARPVANVAARFLVVAPPPDPNDKGKEEESSDDEDDVPAFLCCMTFSSTLFLSTTTS